MLARIEAHKDIDRAQQIGDLPLIAAYPYQTCASAAPSHFVGQKIKRLSVLGRSVRHASYPPRNPSVRLFIENRFIRPFVYQDRLNAVVGHVPALYIPRVSAYPRNLVLVQVGIKLV